MRLRFVFPALCFFLTASITAADTLEIAAPGPIGALAGTLELPEAPLATALILPGSGATDRNGNSELFQADTYRLLAETLAEYRIATARIDKRGLGGSLDAVEDGNDVSFADYIADTRAWRDTLLAQTGHDCLWLIGHSEGSLIAMMAEGEGQICGLVLLTVPGYVVSEELVQQMVRFSFGTADADALRNGMEALIEGRPISDADLPPTLRQMLPEEVRGFAAELFATDPAALLADTTGPVMAVHGTADIQISAEGLPRLHEAREGVLFVTLAGMSHMLKTEELGSDGLYQSYIDPSLPLHPDLVPPMVDFILGESD